MQMQAKILIIDDDPSIGEMLKDILEFSGYKVIYSTKPDDAEVQIKNNDIDLVLLDKLISGVDGTDVCARLKQDESLSHIPIVMMTALHNAEDVCREAGASGFISKPFEMQTLLDTIKQGLAETPSL